MPPPSLRAAWHRVATALRRRFTKLSTLTEATDHLNPCDTASTAQCNSANGLSALPTELLLEIISHPEASDAACLSLCNRSLYGTLIAESRRLVRKDQWRLPSRQREKILVRIARDQPKLYYCCSCSELHTVTSLGQISTTENLRLSVACCALCHSWILDPTSSTRANHHRTTLPYPNHPNAMTRLLSQRIRRWVNLPCQRPPFQFHVSQSYVAPVTVALDEDAAIYNTHRSLPCQSPISHVFQSRTASCW